jgi:hypothetical protein
MVNGLSDATRVVFDDERVVGNAGVMLPALLAPRLGIERLVDQTVDPGDRAAGEIKKASRGYGTKQAAGLTMRDDDGLLKSASAW